MEDRQMTGEEFTELVRQLEEMPERVQLLVEGLAEEQRRWKPSDDEFSALENVCHLKDIEEEGYGVRIRKLLKEREPFLNDLDGARLAIERDYNHQDIVDALNRFTTARSGNVRAVKDLPLTELDRQGMFEGVGPVTLGRLLAMMHEHDSAHLEELTALRNRLMK